MMKSHNLNQATIRYLELVSGKQGEAAIAAWIKWTGYPHENMTRRLPPSSRLDRAAANAMEFGASRAQYSELYWAN